MALLLLLLLSLFMKIVKAVVGNGLVISPHDGSRIWWTSITRVKLTYSVHAVWPDIPGSMAQKICKIELKSAFFVPSGTLRIWSSIAALNQGSHQPNTANFCKNIAIFWCHWTRIPTTNLKLTLSPKSKRKTTKIQNNTLN